MNLAASATARIKRLMTAERFDPQIMYNTIREVGPEHFTLSSDASEPLFPDSVEAMRLVRGYMEAFGLDEDELYTVCTRNPANVVGWRSHKSANTGQRSSVSFKLA